MALTQPTSGLFLPPALATWYTIFTDTTVGIKRFWINKRNLPVNSILWLSFQSIVVAGGVYDEFDSDVIMLLVPLPASPAQGSQAWECYEWVDSMNGFQVQGMIVSGTLPTVGLAYADNTVG